MTTVEYEPGEFRLKVTGHAGSAPVGQDLVCAAVTVLIWTLCDRVTERPGYWPMVAQSEADATIEVRCRPERGQVRSCIELLDTIAAGYALLAEHYPEFVRMETVEG